MWHNRSLFDELKVSAYMGAKRSVCGLQNTPKCASDRGSAPDPTGEVYGAPPTPKSAKEGTPFSISHSTKRLWRLDYAAFGASVWRGIAPKYFPLELYARGPCAPFVLYNSWLEVYRKLITRLHHSRIQLFVTCHAQLDGHQLQLNYSWCQWTRYHGFKITEMPLRARIPLTYHFLTCGYVVGFGASKMVSVPL